MLRPWALCSALLVLVLVPGLLMAPTASPAAEGRGEGQPASDAPAADALPLSFQQFFKRPIGARGLEFDAPLLAAHGRTVRLVGYMVAQERPQPGRFFLSPRPLRMSEHADGEADDLPPSAVTVLLHDSQRERLLPHQGGLLTLTGRLEVGRVEDHEGRVSWVRLHLPAQALAAYPSDAGTAAHAH